MVATRDLHHEFKSVLSVRRKHQEQLQAVIAETTDTPTRYARIVVTDDRGRYLIPDLPKGNYQVWVRGYGLVDSAKVQASLGKTFDLTAVPAPTPAAAAQYYPPIYWFSLLSVPGKNEFPFFQLFKFTQDCDGTR